MGGTKQKQAWVLVTYASILGKKATFICCCPWAMQHPGVGRTEPRSDQRDSLKRGRDLKTKKALLVVN